MENCIRSLIELAKIECDANLENFLVHDMLIEQIRDMDEKRKLLTAIKRFGASELYHLDKDVLEMIKMKERV